MLTGLSIRLLCLIALSCPMLEMKALAEEPPAASAQAEPGAAIILSTGDNMFYYKWFPLDSPAGIGASFSIFKSHYNVDRIIWRGAQGQWLRHARQQFRPEAEELWDLYMMELASEDHENLSKHAAEQARKQGLAFWGYMPLFEVGAGEEATSMAGYGRYAFEEDLREQHPEFCLYDRAGVSKGSTIEWGYPEVRKYFLDRYEQYFQSGGDFSIYDGVIFYTYVENFFPRYTDQYMYSDIAAADFKKRYGVNVFTQDFDHAKYQEMRGEYITQYLREMRQLFNKYNKKLAIYIDGIEPDIPMRWPCYPSVLVPGALKMDWRTWIKEGLVDEIALRSTTDLKQIQPFLDAAKGTKVRISLLTNQMPPKLRSLYEQGVTRHIWSPELPSDFPPQNNPLSALEGDDLIAKMSVLRQIRDGEIVVPVEKITSLFKHPDLIVRRQAVAAVLGQRLEGAIPALEEAAMDPENSFRCVVIDALGTLYGPNTVSVIGKSLAKYPIAQMRLVARTAWAMQASERQDDLIKLFHDTDSAYVRTAILELLIAKRAVPPIDASPAYWPLVEQGAKDQDWRLRATAAFAAGYFYDTRSADLLTSLLNDPVEAVQAGAAFSLGEVARRIENRSIRQAIFDHLIQHWRLFSADSTRADKNWGYRPAIESLMFGFGPRGEQEVVDILNGADKHLAKQAWNVYFHPNDGWNFYELPPDKGEERYAYYPVPTRLKIESKKLTLPKSYDVFVQDFGTASPDPTGQLGDIWTPGGRWTGLDENTKLAQDAGKQFLSIGIGKTGKGARLVGMRAWDLNDGRFKNRLRGHFPSSPIAYGMIDGTVTLNIDVRTSENAAAQIGLAADSRSKPSVGVEIRSDGKVVLNGRAPSKSAVQISPSMWHKVQLKLNFHSGIVTLSIDGSSLEAPFDNNIHLRTLVLATSGTPGATVDVASLRVVQSLE